MKRDKAITLIALVITIVVILILSVIAINVVLGENGLVAKAKYAATLQKKTESQEKLKMGIVEAQAEILEGSNKSLSQLLVEKYSKINSKWQVDVYEEDENEKVIIITTENGRKLKVNVNDLTMEATVDESYYPTSEEAEAIITYDGNGATSGNMETQSAINGLSAKLKTSGYSKTNFVFTGWSRYQSGKDDQGNTNIHAEESKLKIEGDTTLYAQWSRRHAILKFNANGGTGTQISDKNVELGVETSINGINTYTRDGYYFLGWSTEEGEGKTVEYTDKITISIDETRDIIALFAQWQKCYTIKFEAGEGGSGSMTPITNIIPNQEVILTENAFTNTINPYFNGWKEKTSNQTFSDKQKVAVTEDMVLVAQWRDEPYVNLDADGPITLIENYTVPNMTSETTTIANDGTYYAKASTVYTASGRIFGAFDGSANHPCVWHSQLGDANGWTQIKAPYMFQLKDFYLQNRNHSVTYNIHEMKIEASNNEKNWVTIGTYTNPTNDSNAKNHFTVNYNYNNFGYQYYRFTSVSSYSASYTIIGELTLNGNKYSKADTFKNWVRFLNDNQQYINYEELLKVIDYYNNLNATEKQSVPNHYKQLCILTKRFLENMISNSTINDESHNFSLINDAYDKCKAIDANLSTSNMKVVSTFIAKIENEFPQFTFDYSTKNQIKYTLRASTTLDGRMAVDDIFDNSTGVWDSWHSTSGTSQWVELNFEKNVIIYNFIIKNRNGDQCMNGFKLQCKNSSGQWVDMQSFNNRNGSGVSTKFDVTYLYDNIGYKNYRWQSTSSYGSYISIGEMSIKMNITQD